MSVSSTAGEPAAALLFAFFAILFGCVMTYILSRVPNLKSGFQIPYTVWVFLFGVAIATIARHQVEYNRPGKDDSLINSVEQWMNIDPDLLLYTLLPPLLFDEAMKLDSHQVRMALVPSALLALPGAAYGATMQALVCQAFLTYDWSWEFCLIVGSVLSATDPVSVVSMLKSVSGGNTSTVKLTYLITGESLLNDGTALVIFEALVSKEYNSDESVVMYFVRVLLISPLLGIALGLGTVFCLRKAKRRLSPDDNVVQVCATITCAYLSFFTAQWVLKVSGIIACCAAGLIIAWLAPALITQPEQMEVIWHTLEWIGNTLIFATAGLISGKYFSDIDAGVVGSVFIIYVTMMLIRLSMLTICYPAVWWLSRKEYSYKDVIFSTFGGLRGAISLALVLIIEKHLKDEEDIDSHDDPHDHFRYFPVSSGRKAIVIICGCVFLTIVLNGTFAGAFFQWLYGSRLSSDVDEIIFHYVEKRIRRKARDFISHTDVLPPFDSDEVKKLCHCFSYHFSTTEHTKEEKELLDSEKQGKGHVEFDDSDSGKHKIAHLVEGSDPFVKSQKSHALFSTNTLTHENMSTHANMGDSHNTVNVSREGSNSSLTSLANHLLGLRVNTTPTEKAMKVSANSTPTSDGLIKVERRYSESVYRKRYSAGPAYTLNNDLIIKFRQVFHGITKHCYMRQIANGRLTRGSSVALTLLHASRHGTETCDVPELRDFDSILDALEVYDREKQWLSFFKGWFSEGSMMHNFLQKREESYVGDRVYILTSFIEAHNYAQRITIKYLGEKGFVDTEEEALIIQESHTCIKKAQELLSKIDSDVISYHATEMVARMVLNMANDTVMQFREEGILSEKDSEVFLDKSYEDLKHLHSDHNRHAQLKRLRESRATADNDSKASAFDMDSVSQQISSPPEDSSESSRFHDPLAPKKHHDFWFFVPQKSKLPTKQQQQQQQDKDAESPPRTAAGTPAQLSVTSVKSIFDIDTNGNRMSLHTDTEHSVRLRNRISSVDRDESDDKLDTLGLERRSSGDGLGPTEIVIRQSDSHDAMSDISGITSPRSPLAIDTTENQKLSPFRASLATRQAADDDGIELSEPPLPELLKRDSLRDRATTATEIMQDFDRDDNDYQEEDPSIGIDLQGRVNVTELLSGDHDLGDEVDALSRKFQHDALGARDSIDSHAPAEDEEEIDRAEIMAKTHLNE